MKIEYLKGVQESKYNKKCKELAQVIAMTQKIFA